MKITELVPEIAEVNIGSIVAEYSRNVAMPKPFDPHLIDLVAMFSEQLLAVPNVRQIPELVALGFWTRRAALERLRADYLKLPDEESILVSRGVVLHFPPANVDTMFVYSAVLSLLTGNRNIVRISQRIKPAVELLCSVWRSVLSDMKSDVPMHVMTFVTYPHDAETTRALSNVADVRVIWGGDETIRAIRAIPAPPTAVEVSFPDRFSLAAIRADAWLSSGEEKQRALAERFFSDAYWFDQAGCSSPRLVVWFGSPARAKEASSSFFSRLDLIVRDRNHKVTTADVLRKLTFAAEAAIDRPAENFRRYSNELSVITLSSLHGFSREHCGGGLFFETTLQELEMLVPFLKRKDQTLVHFGFDAGELRQLVGAANGRGIQRVVPLGEALSFHRFWDGFDLLTSLTQRVHIRVSNEKTW